MTRHVLIRADNNGPQVVPEAALPTEAELHDALTSHPELIPTSDVGMGSAVVVGRESGLTSGYADLVLVDDRGQVCLVEVKNEGNPDTRRVVAQLLDYAASLWGSTVEEFEGRVLHKYLEGTNSSGPMPGIGEFIVDAVGINDDEGEAAARIAEQLAQGLAAGDFSLVVAAPQIPVRVQRVLEYLNARGQRLFGLEVSYFRGPVECFVPRLVVKPLASDPAGERSASASSVIDRETYLGQVPGSCKEHVAEFLDSCEAVGGLVLWRKLGPNLFVTRDQRRQVAYMESTRIGVAMTVTAGFPEEPYQQAKADFEEAGIGRDTESGWFRTVSFVDTPEADVAKAFEITLNLIRALTPAIPFAGLPSPMQFDFESNDFNIWQKQVPKLASHHGKHLRGRLVHRPSGREAGVDLLPLGGNQPGWKPVFRPSSGREEIWGSDSRGEPFTLVLEASA